jgi:hypothetical protein
MTGLVPRRPAAAGAVSEFVADDNIGGCRMRTKDWKIGLAALFAAAALTGERAAAQTTWMAQEPAGIPATYGRTSALPYGKFTAAYHAGYYQWRADRFAWAQYKETQAALWQARALEMHAAREANVASANCSSCAKCTPMNSAVAMSAPTMAVSSQPATVYMVDAPSAPTVAANAPLPAPVVVKAQDMPGTERVLSRSVIAERVYRVNPDGTQTLISSQDFNGGQSVAVEPTPMAAQKPSPAPTR